MKKIVILALMLAAINHTSVEAAELQGLDIQPSSDGPRVVLDMKGKQTYEVRRFSQDVVDIILPDGRLPEAFSKTGMPPLHSPQAGVTATIIQNGSGIRVRLKSNIKGVGAYKVFVNEPVETMPTQVATQQPTIAPEVTTISSKAVADLSESDIPIRKPEKTAAVPQKVVPKKPVVSKKPTPQKIVAQKPAPQPRKIVKKSPMVGKKPVQPKKVTPKVAKKPAITSKKVAQAPKATTTAKKPQAASPQQIAVTSSAGQPTLPSEKEQALLASESDDGFLLLQQEESEAGNSAPSEAFPFEQSVSDRPVIASASDQPEIVDEPAPTTSGTAAVMAALQQYLPTHMSADNVFLAIGVLGLVILLGITMMIWLRRLFAASPSSQPETFSPEMYQENAMTTDPYEPFQESVEDIKDEPGRHEGFDQLLGDYQQPPATAAGSSQPLRAATPPSKKKFDGSFNQALQGQTNPMRAQQAPVAPAAGQVQEASPPPKNAGMSVPFSRQRRSRSVQQSGSSRQTSGPAAVQARQAQVRQDISNAVKNSLGSRASSTISNTLGTPIQGNPTMGGPRMRPPRG